MNCRTASFGYFWDAEKSNYYNSDKNHRPVVEIPESLKKATTKAQTILKEKNATFKMCIPEVCILNLYKGYEKLGLHRDTDEERIAINEGYPVVSISIGASMTFKYNEKIRGLQSKILEHGDALLFLNDYRRVLHGVDGLLPDSGTDLLINGEFLRSKRAVFTLRPIHKKRIDQSELSSFDDKQTMKRIIKDKEMILTQLYFLNKTTSEQIIALETVIEKMESVDKTNLGFFGNHKNDHTLIRKWEHDISIENNNKTIQ